MREIYRIEHLKTGKGMFSTTLPYFLSDFRKRHMYFNDPHQDKLNLKLNNKEWFCAFKSLNDIKTWITKDELLKFKKNKFKVYKLEVTEYQIGNHQIIYTKESIINKIDITEFLLKKL